MQIYREEIFGPVLGIVRAKTYDEAIGLINDHKYANGTAIFTTNGGAARRFKLEVDVPMIGVNVPIPVPAGYMSFGGAKESAIGDLAMRGEDGVRFFTQQKMVTERWPDPEVVGRPVMRKFSAEYKRRMVEEAARCKPGEIGALLRREGVYSSALTRWRKQYRAGVLSGLSSKAPGPKPKRAGQLAAEVARLERENRRLKRRLEKAELIITFQKKACELLGIAPGEPPQNDEES
jgi:transposase-like protein